MIRATRHRAHRASRGNDICVAVHRCCDPGCVERGAQYSHNYEKPVKNAPTRLIRPAAHRTMRAMKPGIALKFFLAILLAAAVAAAAMAVATRLSFQWGFLGYLNQVDAQRLDELAAEGAVKPIVVDGGTVGWIARAPLRRLSSAAEVSFQQEQLRASWLTAALALALAAGLAVVLGRAFVTPVKRLADATHRLAAGNYATRVPVDTPDELGRLAADFNRLAETLERNETLRRRFMADVSHELRTPLAVLSAELEALEDGVRPLTRESLASLRGEVNALGKLVGDLNQLALADVGALAYRKQTVNVVPLVQQALESYRERFAERGLAIETALAGDARVFGDADRLVQLFRNLLENSARYTDPGGRVQIALRREDGRAILDFDDAAPGVPAASLPHLFERFYRVDASRSRANGGAGLGLAICSSIAAAHGGEIAAAPSPLGGLRVRVALPLAT